MDTNKCRKLATRLRRDARHLGNGPVAAELQAHADLFTAAAKGDHGKLLAAVDRLADLITNDLHPEDGGCE